MRIRRLVPALAVAGAVLTTSATPADAVVGGRDASPGEYPSVAEVSFGAPGVGLFGCTGTLISPTYVLTAGHCGSLTGAVGVAQPVAAWPPQSFDILIGSHKSGDGERVTVKSVKVHPNYVFKTDDLYYGGYDISLLELTAPAKSAPTPIAGLGERDSWLPGKMATVAGWGLTEEDGSAPDTLQEAEVPITTDEYCAKQYEDLYTVDATMVCAGFPEGGVDTCQGDSGGPLFSRNALGQLRVAGATSFGEGCARAGYPGVYARVADKPVRDFIVATAGAAAFGTETAPATGAKGGGKKPRRAKAKRVRAKRRA